jgi:RNA polymerase sigma factor (sigma-70 family)
MDPYEGCTDEELAAAAARGDELAFRHLHFRHQRRILGLAMLKLPAASAEDTVQEVFLALHNALAEGRSIGTVGGWLTKVARNKIADFHRGRAGTAHRTGMEYDDDAAVLDAGYAGADLSLVVDRVLAELSETHRLVVRRAFLENAPAAEVAAETGESAANVYQIVSRFRTAMRAALGNDYGNQDRM